MRLPCDIGIASDAVDEWPRYVSYGYCGFQATRHKAQRSHAHQENDQLTHFDGNSARSG